MTRILHWLDVAIFNWLMTHSNCVPDRLVKSLAWHYPDARVRRLYWSKLNVCFGEGSFANPGFLVVNTPDADARVTIGARVSIGPGVILVTDSSPSNSTYLMRCPEVAERMLRRAPIVIGDDSWIGAGVTILPGVHVGRGAIIGANSLVIANVDEGCVVAGAPARAIRRLESVAKFPEDG